MPGRASLRLLSLIFLSIHARTLALARFLLTNRARARPISFPRSPLRLNRSLHRASDSALTSINFPDFGRKQVCVLRVYPCPYFQPSNEFASLPIRALEPTESAARHGGPDLQSGHAHAKHEDRLHPGPGRPTLEFPVPP